MTSATTRATAIACLMAAAFASSACGHRAPSAAPSDFSIIRQYGWDCDVPDPQPAWSPNDYRVAARSSEGFVVLHDETGTLPADSYKSLERRESHHLVWINPEQVVFGPSRNADKLPDGRVVPLPDGLTIVTLGRVPQQRLLARIGFHPRVGQGFIYAQSEDRMLKIDEQGMIADFGRGFLPEPQRDEEGVAWQDTPMVSEDWWTGKPALSNLVVRWKPGKVDQVPSGVQPRWSFDGGVAATVLRAAPQADKPWWKAGTDVVFIAGPGRPTVLVAHDARDPAPHPVLPVIAVATAEGKIALVSRDGTQRQELVDGCNPQWSHDGTRLLVEPVPAEGAALPTTQPHGRTRLTVYVVAVRSPLK